MASSKKDETVSMIDCPVFGKKIHEGLCWDLSNLNLGKGTEQLSPGEIPPCGWQEARKICDLCPHYSEWD